MANRSAPRLVCLGEALVDMVALDQPRGSLAAVERFARAAGGAPANVAVGAARLGGVEPGLEVGFVGKVGADPFGDFLATTLAAEGVDVAGLTRAEGARTAVAFVALGPAGERDFLFYRERAADTLLRADELPEEYLAGATVLHVGSLSLIEEPARGATLHALALAERHGVKRSFDPNLRLDLWPSAAAAHDRIMSVWPRMNVVKLSEEELEFLTGSTELEAARPLLHDALELLCVTRGAGGVDYLAAPGGAATPFAGHVAAPRVAAIDTTGAGDAFTAALLGALCLEPRLTGSAADLERALARATAFAALTTTRHGAIPALPSAAELEAFLAAGA